MRRVLATEHGQALYGRAIRSGSSASDDAMLLSVLPLVIKSNNAGDRLVIHPDRPDYWTATLECSELQARHSFYEIHIDSLPHFLSGLAAVGAAGRASASGSRSKATLS
jgi:hypothetical protein